MTRAVIKLEESKIKKIVEEFSQIGGKVPVALSRALNRAATSGKAESVRKVRETYTAKAKDVRQGLKVERSKPNNLNASVVSRAGSLPLDRFKISPMTVNPKRKSKITAEVKKGERKTLDGPFIARVGSATSVFARVGASRLPIERLYGPSVPVMMNNEGVVQSVLEKAEETFDNRIGHELNRILGGK